ncbi:hypothetical protein PR003_g19681 [Phytophthora rubi]|uniref:Uncharacterized protein n=1 Tax=Phytophthora rubi TaxID=129364 RepID=A0A6A4DR13_9STRA|nr:hypothetical protein PR002_g19149 [Phytophthora rubi]KAE9312787.1 hypothetical protein PR003_g19681 [Phytophthora rubi]
MLPSYQCSFCCLVAVSVGSNSIRYGISGKKSTYSVRNLPTCYGNRANWRQSTYALTSARPWQRRPAPRTSTCMFLMWGCTTCSRNSAEQCPAQRVSIQTFCPGSSSSTSKRGIDKVILSRPENNAPKPATLRSVYQ